MKKLVCTLLSIVLMLAVICPLTVFADEDDSYGEQDDSGEASVTPAYPHTPFWEMFGFDSADEFMDYYGQYWAYHPDAETFWEAIGETSREDFMEWFDVTEEECLALDEAWNKVKVSMRKNYDDILEELGGIPGIVNININGAFMEFSNAVPEIIDGSTFVPAGPFFTMIGASASFEATTRTVTVLFPDKTFSFTIGEDVMSITENSDVIRYPLDAPTYIKDGSFYIPIRSVAMALSYSIYWDREFRTVVIIDYNKIISEINKDFTILNRLFELQPKKAQDANVTYMTALGILASITVFDSLDGNTDMMAAANVTVYSDGRNLHFSADVDLTGLVSLILDEYNGYGDDMDELNQVLAVVDTLNKDGIEIILNRDEDVLYIYAPFLSEIVPEIPGNAWIAIGGISRYIGVMELDSLVGLIEDGLGIGSQTSASSIGEMIVADYSPTYYYGTTIFLYDRIMEGSRLYKELFSDEKFTRDDSSYTLAVTTDDYLAAISGENYYSSGNLTVGDFIAALTGIGGYYSSAYYTRLYELTITIRMSGDEGEGATGRYNYRYGYSYGIGSPATQTSYEFDISREEFHLSYEVHERNVASMRIVIDQASTETNVPVPTAPPEGATIIAIEDILGDSYGNTFDTVTPMVFTH